MFWKPIYHENARDKILDWARDLGQEISALRKRVQGSAGRNHFRHPAIDSYLDHFFKELPPVKELSLPQCDSDDFTARYN